MVGNDVNCSTNYIGNTIEHMEKKSEVDEV